MIELFTVLGEMTETPDGTDYLKLHVELNDLVFTSMSDERTKGLLKLTGKSILDMVDDIEIDRSEVE
jgi:hypothetical protein